MSRLYAGRLPPNVTRQDVEDHFKGFKLRDVRLMGNFGFIEFDSPQDAEDALRDFSGRSFLGENIVLEFPRETRRRDFYDGGRGPPGSAPPSRGPPRRGVRVHVVGIPQSTSWQDLKDYGRIGNPNVMFADVDRNNPGTGIIEFASMDEAEEAITRLSGVDINNTPVKLEIAPGGGGGDGGFRGGPPRDSGYDRPRYDDRGPPRDYDRPRYDDRRDDRGPPPPRRDDREQRGQYGEPRRDYPPRDREREREYAPRDRSPPRRRDDDRYNDRAGQV